MRQGEWGVWYRPASTQPCRRCGTVDDPECWPDKYPRCSQCGCILLYARVVMTRRAQGPWAHAQPWRRGRER
jgi:hypothetical protein